MYICMLTCVCVRMFGQFDLTSQTQASVKPKGVIPLKGRARF